ncbi:MAG TPA: amidase family protein [Steroidobacteraceae bacterium]|jgi:amidase
MISKDVVDVLLHGSIPALQELLRSRRCSGVELTQWYLRRIDAFNHVGPRLNAVRVLSTHALEDARRADADLSAGRSVGALHGIPVLIKDNVFIAHEYPAPAGVAALLQFVPRHTATIVERLTAAGAIVLGKTNLTEFADYVADVMPAEFSSAGGVVRNPHGIAYGRGQGSSVGSAAAVAAAFAPIAIGGETQNSIQTPANYSSVVGFKPSVGMVSRAGIIPLVPSQDAPGVLTRSVGDAALVFDVIAGADAHDPVSVLMRRDDRGGMGLQDLAHVRIGAPRRAMAQRPEFSGVLALFDAALAGLARAGAVIIDPCDLPSAEQLQEVRSCVFKTEFKASLDAFLQAHEAPCGIGSLEALVRWNDSHPEHIPYGQSLLLAALETRGLNDPRYRLDRLRDIALSRAGGIDAALLSGNVDVLIAPMGAAAKCTGKAGTPTLAIPVGVDASGVPFGVTLYTANGKDALLLAVGQLVERAIGDRRLPRL